MVGTEISDNIKNRIKKIVKDEKEIQFLLDLLECELAYVDQEKPDFKKDFKSIIEQRFPFRST
ncbi:MAG: hypothetical protein HOL90_00315 [Candidatus Nitrosopelagicus sp.]|mgnify:FL=1|nr:hypothetical protein [Candidatus Nitrosopelagicus sp.]